MAIRKRLSHDDKTREKIQTSQFINRLTKFINGEVELSPAQVRAIEVLLKKTLPDLQAISLDGKVDATVIGRMVFDGLNG